jgi:CheY-like chemotaxis protein
VREGSSVVVKVLYIEDNDDDAYMLKMRLELLGNFEVLTAADGERGCEAAAAEQPDIILMDIEMPVVDGWQAARRLKGNSQTQDIPIIALSAHALVGERRRLPRGARSSTPNRSNLIVWSQWFGGYWMAAVGTGCSCSQAVDA